MRANVGHFLFHHCYLFPLILLKWNSYGRENNWNTTYLYASY